MERYKFEMIPVPAEALTSAGISPGIMVEAFADGDASSFRKYRRKTFAKLSTRTAKAALTAVPAAANA